MVVDWTLIVWGILFGIVIGLMLGMWFGVGRPPVAGELIVDTHDWDVDKYKFVVNDMALSDIPNHKYISLKVSEAVIETNRDHNKAFNDTD